MTYQEALDYLAGLAPRGWRLGLDRMREFAHRAGLDDALGPERPSYLHVAGTNGKGSTVAYLQSILHESGHRTGAFFSPYVYDPRERIQLGREFIPEAIFAGLTAMLMPIAEEFTESEFGGISEFEFKTAMAFLFYKRLQCDWVALEVGLGGRLDATNIVHPSCSVIVSVGLDHTNVLGTTLHEIAHEKAGVIKPGVPAVVGSLPEEAMQVVEREAAEKGCQIWRYGQEIVVGQAASDGSIVVTTPAGQHAGLSLGIQGAMQGHNMALAVAACDAAGATRTLGGLQRGTAKASIPGRFEIHRLSGRTIVLDGAHNADAARVLVKSLETFMAHGVAPGSREPEGPLPGKRMVMVTGMVAGHDPESFYRPFGGLCEEVIFVPIQFHRAVDPTELAQVASKVFPSVATAPSVARGLADAIDRAGENGTVLVTGSFYLVGAAGAALESL